MAHLRGCFVYLIWFTLYLTNLVGIISALNLSQVSSKPRQTKFSSLTTTETAAVTGSAQVAPTDAPAKKDDSGVAVYRLTQGDSTCILLKTDALVEVNYKLHNLEEKADSFIPDRPLIEGNCRDEDTSFMRISWTGYSLVMTFQKTPGGERWFIRNLELTVSPDLPNLHGIPVQGKSSIKLYHHQMLIPTPVGKSYSCAELVVNMETDPLDRPPAGVRGTLFLRLLQLQPFMYKGEDFEEAVECRSQKSFRDETAPIAVGSTLALAVLVTVTGYGIYRYFKVKNVQYNTME